FNAFYKSGPLRPIRALAAYPLPHPRRISIPPPRRLNWGIVHDIVEQLRTIDGQAWFWRVPQVVLL
ncbi:MAG TPA: hypothetical protein PKD54_11305, partial [Pirellulaceae bacterium]|nr:hypothetical protein [Pirellulaceae bacterium]